MRKFNAFFILTFFVISFTGCSSLLHKEPVKMNTEEIMKLVRERIGALTTLHSNAEITFESGFRLIPVNAKLYFTAPDWLTVRAYGPMNLKIVEFSLQKNTFQVYSLFTNEFFTGNLDSVDVSKSFKMPMPDIDLRSVYSHIFCPQDIVNARSEVRIEGKYYIISFADSNSFREVWINSRKMLIERENFLDSQKVLKYYIAFGDYKKKSGVRFPRKIEIGDIDRGVKLTIESKDFKINDSVKESDMMLSVPPDAKRMELRNIRDINKSNQ